MKKTVLFTLILLLFTAGCTAPVTISPLETPQAAETATSAPTEPATAEPATAPAATQAMTMTPVVLVTEAPPATMTPTPTPTPEPTATPTVTPTPEPQVRASGKNVNVRRGPGTLFPVMAVLRDGETAQVIASGPKGWLQIDLDGKTGWIYSGVVETIGPVETLAMAENIPTPPPTPTPVPPTATPPPAQVGPQLPPKQDVVYLSQDTQFPVRANRFIGWGYEIVDASEKWDIVMYRDVFGYVLHEFFGDELYKQHPHGMRVTFLDCVPKTMKNGVTLPCAGTEAPVTLLYDKRLSIGIGDGIGSVITVGCAVPWTNYYDPQECFLGLGPNDAGFMTDVAIVGMIVDENVLFHALDGSETPDFRNPPFTPHLGVAIRDEQLQQWRWKDPFLKIVPQQ